MGKEAGESTPLQPAEKEASGRCEDFGLLLRLWAWMMHAMLDGVLIGSADQLAVLIPLSFAILICAIQDVAGLYIYFDARGATTHFVAIALVLFFHCLPHRSWHLARCLQGLEGKRPGARRIALRDGWPLRVHGLVRACTPARARPGPKPEILLRVQLWPHVGIHG